MIIQNRFPNTSFLGAVFQVIALMLATCLIGCNQSNDPADNGDANQAKNNGNPVRTDKKPTEPIDDLKAMGAVVRLDKKENVIVVQVRGGKATDDTAKLLAAMPSLKDVQLTGTQVTDAAIDSLIELK